MTYTKPEVVKLASAIRAIESTHQKPIQIQTDSDVTDLRPENPAYEADD